MAGLRIMEMDAADALDVIHVLMEEDSVVQTREIHASKHEVRSIIYGEMYDDLHWKGDNRGTQDFSSIDGPIGEENTRGAAAPEASSDRPKPYMPPTSPERLSAVLDEPMQ